MGCNLSRPLCFPKYKVSIQHDEHVLAAPMESALSQLPFFSESSVDGRSLPPRYLTVCQGCWEGPFAMHLGLPCVSTTDGRLYRNWPRSYSYSISPTELKSRADMGCVWCRLLVAAHGGESSFPDPSRPLEISVQGVVRNRDHWSPQNGQRIHVTIDDKDVYEGVVHSDRGASGHIYAR